MLTTQATPGGCAATPKACDLNFAGIAVQDGRVVDTITVTCHLRPVTHLLRAWIEYKPFDTWDAYGRTLGTPDIPGSGRDPDNPTDQPLRVTVSSPCLEGTYRTQVRVEGKGTVNEATPEPIPFEFGDTGRQKFLSAEDCAEGRG